MRKWSTIVQVALIALLASGCGVTTLPVNPPPSTTDPGENPAPGRPSIVINAPPSGSNANVGQEVIIHSAATDVIGVNRIDMLVNGAVARSDTTLGGSPQTEFSAFQSWIPTQIGAHNISVIAFRPDGVASDLASIIVNVLAGEAASTPSLAATLTYTPTYTVAAAATLTFTPTFTATNTVVPTRTFTPTPPPPTAPADPEFNSPLTIPLDSTASVTDFVSYPDGDREDKVRYDVTGMNPNASLSGGRAQLIIAASCFGTGTQHIQFSTGGQTFSCGQTIVNREITTDSKTGTITITAVGGDRTYVQWVLTGSATRNN